MTIEEAKEFAETNIVRYRKTIKKLKSVRMVCTGMFVVQSTIVATQILFNDVSLLSIVALLGLPCSALFNTHVIGIHYKVLDDLLMLREEIRKEEIKML